MIWATVLVLLTMLLSFPFASSRGNSQIGFINRSDKPVSAFVNKGYDTIPWTVYPNEYRTLALASEPLECLVIIKEAGSGRVLWETKVRSGNKSNGGYVVVYRGEAP